MRSKKRGRSGRATRDSPGSAKAKTPTRAIRERLGEEAKVLDARQAERLARLPKLPTAKRRPAILNEIDPEGRYGTGTGPRFSESAANVEGRLIATGEALAADLARRLLAGDTPYALDREEGRLVQQLLGVWLPQLHRTNQELERRIALARLVATRGKGIPATRFRRALSWVLDRERSRKAAPRFNARGVIDDYATITQSRGAVSMWHPIERILDLPGFVVEDCPLSPASAIDVLVKRHGFKTYTACLRFLQRQLEAAKQADEDSQALVAFAQSIGDDLPGMKPSWIVEALSHLPQER